MPKTKATAPPTVKKPRAAKTKPTSEEIALRAYHIYLERGGTPGNAFEDWTRAERELHEQTKKPRRRPAQKSVAA